MASLLDNLQQYVGGDMLQMLDRNKSGSVMDEAAGMFGKFFGKGQQ